MSRTHRIVSGFLAAVLLLAISSAASADLLGLYQFEGNVLDSSVQGNDGANNGVTFAPGFAGQSGVFNGAAFVDVPVDLNPAVAPRATIGAWVNAAVLNNPVRHEIVSTDNGGFDRAITIDSRGDTGGESGTGTYSAFNGTGALLNGTPASVADGWVFIAATYDHFAQETTLYVDNASFTEPGVTDPSQTFTRIGAHPGSVEFFNGSIDNVFLFDRELTATEIGSIRTGGAPAVLALANDPEIDGTLWSVDIHAVGGTINANPTPPLMTGVEPYYGHGNIWNAFEVAGHDLTTIDPAISNMVDSNGDPTSVGFQMFGTLSGWSQPTNLTPPFPLTNDYVFVQAGNSDPTATWEITGLTAGDQYELMVYGGVSRVALITVDTDGDGNLAGETTKVAPANSGVLFENVTPDASGRIVGNFLNNGAETNWSGFQLRNVTIIPEPTAAALLLLGACLALLRRW